MVHRIAIDKALGAAARRVQPLGCYPTPVQKVPSLSTPRTEIWLKRDDLTHPVYGGSKVRKLERLLPAAVARGAARVVTIGAAGSHHVLATAYFGREAGLEVEAVLFPQPATDHVVEVLRAGVGLGLRAFPVASVALAPFAVVERIAEGARLVPPGGSSVEGALAYVDAARELAAQVRRGELPEPDWCVTALGSGGTAAGLAAGFAAEGLKTRVVAVCVLTPIWLASFVVFALARACARRIGRAPAIAKRPPLVVDRRFVGGGYGYATTEGAEASRRAESDAGIVLDPTYTAKAFACALGLRGAPLEGTVLYWHTLSSARMSALLEGAPNESALDPSLKRLLARGARR
ncbi:MAG: pyridoxal-phosphate dependent enzyme [Polyangiaceae bacterium]|nr:pyridoxal-phosphate dependent enzyme [Polyangiaceae bacterium]